MNGLHFDRKSFLEAAGALVVTLGQPSAAKAVAVAEPAHVRDLRQDHLQSWIAIENNGKVTIYCGKIDGGVGISTAFAQILADELDAPYENITMVMADTALTPDQGKSTASNGILIGVQPLRVAAAEARHLLIQKASDRLGIPAAQLDTRDGFVFETGNAQRRVSYGDLVAAQRLDLTLEIDRQTSYGPILKVKTPLKAYAKPRMIGQAVPRRDLAAKVTGVFKHVHNVRVPGMLHGRVVHPPAAGAKLVSVDESSIAHLGEVKVVRKADFIGVVARREEVAVKAAATLKATWTAGTPLPDQRHQYDDLRKWPVLGQTDTLKVGDVDQALGPAGTRLRASYGFPYQMHGMLGPSCAVVDARPNGATVWSGTQWPGNTRDDIAIMLGLPKESVRLIWHEASGSYGRLGCDDAATDAAIMSAAVGQPVRVQWMRHDEHGFEPVSPGVAIDCEARLDRNGKIAAFSLLHHAQSTAVAEAGSTVGWRLLGTAPGLTKAPRLAGFPGDSPYELPAQRFRVIHVSGPYRTIFMRAPGIQQSFFGVESFMDELAEAAGVDPIEFRLRHVTNQRDRDVIQTAVKAAGWDGKPSKTRGANLPVLTGRGMAHGRWAVDQTRITTIADVRIERATGKLRVVRLFIAHDCGLLINPDGAMNQVEGATLQGVSRSIHEEVRYDDKGVVGLDWIGYPILRYSEAPELHITLINRPGDAPSGAGESGTVTTTAAIANAIYDATGKRLREAPFTAARVKALFS